MPEVQLAEFLAFLAVPVLSLVFMGKIRSWGLTGYVFFLAMGALSFVMLGGLTLLMAGGYDVVLTEATEIPSGSTVIETASERDYAMNVTSFTATAQIYATPQIQAEFVSDTSSALYLQEIECIGVQIRKAGSPTGNAVAGVFNSTGGTVKTFGTQDVAALTTSNVWHSYCLTDDSYILQSGDRVGLQYTGGDASNNVVIVLDGNNPFDGTLSYRQQFATGSWTSQTAQDMTMQLWKGEDETTTTETITYTDGNKTIPIINEYQTIWSYIFGAFVVVFGLSYFYVMVKGGP